MLFQKQFYRRRLETARLVECAHLIERARHKLDLNLGLSQYTGGS